MQSVNNLTALLNSGKWEIRTGIVQHYVNGMADVAIIGSVVTIPVLDSVTIALGQVVVCAMNGGTGYVIGSLNGTIRADSGWYTGGYGNPQAPNYDYVPPFGTTEIQPTGVSAVNSSGSYVQNALGSSDPWTWGFTTTGSAHWYFGASAFSSLNASMVTKIELLLNGAGNTGSTVTLNTHTQASAPVSAPTLTSTSISGNSAFWTGYVDVTSALLPLLTAGGTWGVALAMTTYSAPSVSVYLQPPYGSLRFTYTQ